MASYTFTLDPYEIEVCDVWKEVHEATAHADLDPRSIGAVGGRYTYIFTPTSLGSLSRVRCNVCFLELDITDFSNW